MSMEWIGGLIFLAAVVVWFGFFVIMGMKTGRKRKEQELEALEAEPELPEVDLIAVTVLARHTDLTWEGNIKTPSSRVNYLVQFELDCGEKLSLAVDEAHYAAMHEGDSGTLALQGGSFLDFVPGEYPDD